MQQQDTPLTLAETMCSSLTRDETRHLVYWLNSLGISLLLKEGKVAARPRKGEPLPIEALDQLRTHKADLLEYLTTPPTDTEPCGACGRSFQWVLDPVGIWVCDCYYHSEVRTGAALDEKEAEKGRPLWK